jgi:hypothetical protein
VLTPQEWFDKLEQKFRESTKPKWRDKKERPRDPAPREEWLDTLWSYYCGDPPLPQVSAEYQDVFRDIMRKARCNPSEMCVSAVVARMELLGISTKLDNDANGDDIANEIMENSGFAAQFKDIEVFKSAMGESFGLVVAPPEGSGEKPSIHAIDPRRCVGIDDPLIPVRMKAVLIKEFDEELGRDIAHMFLPGKKWTIGKDDDGKWDDVPDEPTEFITGITDLGGIPVVRFSNPLGMGEYEGHIDVLDRLIDITLQSMILMRFQAMRPTAVMGDEPEEDEYDDERTEHRDLFQPPPSLDAVDQISELADRIEDFKDVLKAGPGEVWKLPKDWKVWQGAPGDVQGILGAKRDASKEFATNTHTPLYLIQPDDAQGSAAGAEILREALTSKVRDRRSRDTVSLKLLWRIAFAMAGEKARGGDIKLRWGPIEFKSLAEKGSATTQAKGVLSNRRIQRDIWEMPPEDIAENEAELEAERLMADARASALAARQQQNQQNQAPTPGQPQQPPRARPEPVNDPAAVA